MDETNDSIQLGEFGRDEYVEYMRLWSKRYLQRVRSAVHSIAMIRSEMDELASMMDGLTGIDYARVHVSAQPDDEGLLRRIERLDSLKAEYQEELDQNLQWQADAHAALSHVRQPWRAVLTYRYLDGMTWADVKNALGDSGKYSEDYIRKEMHDNGLVELFPYIPHEYDELPGAI